VKKTPIRS